MEGLRVGRVEWLRDTCGGMEGEGGGGGGGVEGVAEGGSKFTEG